MGEVGGQRFPCFSFKRPRLSVQAADAVHVPKQCSTLGNWSSEGAVTTVEANADQTETVTVRSNAPVGQGAGFFRLDAESAQQ